MNINKLSKTSKIEDRSTEIRKEEIRKKKFTNKLQILHLSCSINEQNKAKLGFLSLKPLKFLKIWNTLKMRNKNYV